MRTSYDSKKLRFGGIVMGVMLKRLYIHNFKSFWESEFKFGKVNCLIAPNNAGKSNLVEALIFLDNLIYKNPQQAINRVGLKKIKNYHYNEDEIRLEAVFDIKNRVLVFDELFDYDIECIYTFLFDVKKKNFNVNVSILGKIKNINIEKVNKNNMLIERVTDSLDKIIANYSQCCKDLETKDYKEFEFMYSQNSLSYEIKTEQDSTKEMIVNLFNLEIDENKSILKKPLDFDSIFYHFFLFSSHYFHPHTIKRTQSITPFKGYIYLLEDGTNIQDYLKRIDKELFEDISTSLIGEVELIKAIEIRDNFTPDLIFKEELNGEVFDIGIGDVSDGTIHFIAIMSAILGNKNSIGLIIEEPERHMHMKVLSYILDTMRDDNKQIFFTTHSTEMLNYLELNEVVFLFRDFDGNTKGERATDIPHIKDFMKRYNNDLVELIQTGVVGEYEEY